MQRNIQNKNKKEGFNDLLLPILGVLCILPFVVRLAVYDCGYGDYTWYSNDGLITDMYSYYRSYFFVIITGICMMILPFWLWICEEKRRSVKIFIPLGVYGILALVSTICSANGSASLTGNFYQFQSVFVLLGYVVIAFYTYQVMQTERDYKTVKTGLMVMFVLMAVLGILQIFGQDILNYDWVQKLIMSEEYYTVYGGQLEDVFTTNHVFLTLFNPNYAGCFLVMCASIWGIFAIGTKGKSRIGYGVLFGISLLLLWFTYSRTAVLALCVSVVVYACCQVQRWKQMWKIAIPVVIAVAVIFVGIDATQDFSFLSRMKDEEKEVVVDTIMTQENGVFLAKDRDSYLLQVDDGKLKVSDANGKMMGTADRNEEVIIPIAKKFIRAFYYESDKAEGYAIMVQISDDVFEFLCNETGYYYVTENDKLDILSGVDYVDMHGYEYLGSGRLYIWSRTLPLLWENLLVGSGPDTFAEVFPQNDYVGKSIYAESTAAVMESAHNDYLTRSIQTGVASVISILVFYVLFIRSGIKYYRKRELSSAKEIMGFGAFLGCIGYMVCCLFNDSTLYTTPMFYICIGLSLAVTEKAE